MNSYTLTLSSNSTSYTKELPILEMEDNCVLSVNTQQLYNSIIPIYVKIAWGDGTVETFDNDCYGNNTYNNLIFMNFNPCLTDLHTHEYFPSETCLYKWLYAQILIKYSDGNVSYFQQPIQIRTYDFYDSIGRLEIINVNLNKTQKEYQFKTSTGLVELKTP